jgi:hypothetical protein
MRRVLPVAVAIGVGLIMLFDFFFDNIYLNAIGQAFVDWAMIILAFALLLGLFNVLGFHAARITRRERGWPYSIALVLIAVIVLAVGLPSKEGPLNPLARALFDYVQAPLQASVMALLAFYVAFAAYRAFRVRNWETFLLVLGGFIVLVGEIPLARYIWDGLPALKDWILDVPSTAGARGIVIGVALGTLGTGLRVLLGLDRPYSE